MCYCLWNILHKFDLILALQEEDVIAVGETNGRRWHERNLRKMSLNYVISDQKGEKLTSASLPS